MKKIYSLLVMMLVGFAATWADTSTLTFESKCNGSGIADDGVEWTVTSDGTESNFDNTKGIHYGTGSNAVQYIKLSTSSITGTITEVKVNASTASGVSATASVTVGGAAFGGDAQSLSTTAKDYTFTGSASGEIEVTVTKPSSATKAIYVKSVAVTYTESGEPAQTYAITYNEMENGSVTGPAEAAEGTTVTLTVEPDNGYQLASLTVEDENDVAISVSNNKFTMPAGPVYVSATFEEIPPLTSLATVNAYDDGTEFTFTAPTVVLGKKNRNMYIVTADNAAGTLLYASSNWADDYTFGKEIAGGWSGSKTTYNTKPEVTNPTGMSLSGNEVTLTPVEISAADLTLANFGRYAVLRSAVSDGSAITDANNVAVTTYNQFDVAVPAAGTYDIYGVIGWNNDAGQFMILSFEAVDVPEPTKYAIEIDDQIVNGSIEADKAEAAEGETVTLTVTPDNGYKLEAITVLDGEANEVAVTANNTFTMPASDVIVSATFVEQGEQPQPGTEGTATFVFSTEGGNYYYTADTDIVDVELTAGDITLVFGKTSGTAPKYYASDHTARAYNGSTMTFTAPTGSNITAIAFDYERGGAGSADSGTYGNGAWSGAANSVVISLTATTRVQSITVTYTEATPVTKYAIEIDDQIVNGSIEADKAEAAEGETVTLTVTPDNGYKLDAITVLDGEANEVEVSANYTFEMPASNVIVSATFVEQGEQPQPGTEGTATFVFNTEGGNYYYTADTEIVDVPLTAGDITLVFGKTSGNDPKYYASDHTARAYNGSTMTFTAPTGSNITAIAFDYERGGAGSADSGTYGNGAWSGSANSVVISLTATTRVRSIEVTYAGAEPEPTEFYITATPPAGTYEGPQTVFLEGHNGEIDQATYTINEGAEKTYDAQTGILIDKSCTLSVFALDGDANEATLEAAYVITFPELEVTLTPEAGTYYEAQNVKVAVANVYDDGEYLVSYKIGEGAEQEYDAEAGIDITESCTLTISVEATYQSFEQSYEYVITEAPEILTENATIVFKGGNAESGISTLEALESYVEEGYALISAAEFDAVYSAKVEDGQEKDGIRINKGSYQGSLKLTLANAYAANKLIVRAMPYGTDAAKMLVNGTQFNMTSGAGFADYEVTLDGSALNEITIAAAQKSTCRFYVKSISIICEEPVATTDMAEVTEAGEYVVTVGNVVAFDDDANMVYTTDGQENWLPILIEDADLYAEAKAAATLSQIAGSFDASKTAPLFTATAFKAEGEFVENSQEIYTFDLSDDKAVIDPKAGQVIKIKGIWDGRELRAYSGANGGNRGRSFTVLGATDALVEGTAYSIPVAVTLKEAWDEEEAAGAPKRVAKDGDAAFQNLQGKIVGGADMIEGVSTAVTDLNSDKAISGVQYVNVAGQVSAEPFDGVNIVVTTYVDGTRSAVKVVR